MKNLLLHIFLLTTTFLFAQKELDTVFNKININVHDTVNARVLYHDGEYISEIDPALSIKYLLKAYDFAKPHHNNRLLSDITNKLGNSYYYISDYNNSLKYFIASLRVCENDRNSLGIAGCHNNIGTIYLELGETNKALKHHEQALKLRLDYKPTSNDVQNMIAMSYGNIGRTYFTMSQYTKALEYYKLCYDLSKQLGNKKREALMLNNIGSLYGEQKNYKEAFYYFNEAYDLYKDLDSKENIALCLNNIAEVHFRNNEYEKSIEQYKASLIIATELSSLSDMKTSYEGLHNCYLALNDYKTAHEYLTKYSDIKDSIFNEVNASELNNLMTKFDADSKDKEIKLLMSAQSLKDAQIKNGQIITYASIIVVILVSVFAIYIYYMLRLKQKINKELDVKNQKIEIAYKLIDSKQTDILDSINYARRIQYELLANHDFLKKSLKDFFIMFKPKDIVSGDFYWATETSDNFYLAVCDCTGHGVPGAFMSLLSIGFLNEAINEKGIVEPNEIFNYTRDRLILSISKEGQRDGFDGVLICKNKNTGIITYAAANNAPVLVSDCKICVLPKDRMPVGQSERATPFNLFSIPAKSNDILYLYTDGYADQFGGNKGKKLKNKLVNELILKHSALPMNEQGKIHDNEFNVWKGNFEQVDDVLIVGITI